MVFLYITIYLNIINFTDISYGANPAKFSAWDHINNTVYVEKYLEKLYHGYHQLGVAPKSEDRVFPLNGNILLCGEEKTGTDLKNGICVQSESTNEKACLMSYKICMNFHLWGQTT